MTADSPGPLVSAIVPAWNAQATLGETLRSAAAQTHRNLEIIIVDDGSIDDTAGIARSFCESDARARLISQDNRGVAAARNRAIEEARGEYLAPLDADDLWHPEKIQRQLETFVAASPRVGLVYCWYRMIDGDGRSTAPPWAPLMEGSVFREHLKCNFGTGSVPLIRRSALGDIRYSSELGEAGNQGCEDWLLQLRIAAEYEIACTRAFLLDYRQGSAAMSADKARMIRSHIQMYEIVRREFPGAEIRTIERELARWRMRDALGRGGNRWLAIARAVREAPLVAFSEILFAGRR